MRDQRQSPDRDPQRRHSAPAALPGKSNLTDAPRPTSPGVGKQSRVELIADGTQLRASMASTVAQVAAQSSSASGSTPGAGGSARTPAETSSSGGDAALEQTLVALQQSLARMQVHLDEWEARFGTGEAEPTDKGKAREESSHRPSVEGNPDGRRELDSLAASVERMQALLAELGPETAPPSPRRPPHRRRRCAHPPCTNPRRTATRPMLNRRPPRPHPPRPSTRPNPTPDLAPDRDRDTANENASYDLKKRVFKALSYGGAAVGTAGSFAGWVASHWVGTKIQQTSQTAGGLAKNVVGAVGDYYDSREKATHDPPGNTSGFTQKIAGQLISALGQAISLVGVVAPGADAARPTGAAVNGIGMIFVGFGELDQGNKAKAYANFAGAACNFIGAAGGGIISAKTEQHVAKIVAEALLDVGADSNAWTPLGGAWDDAAKSKAAGDNRWEKMKHDPKPGGQAINGLGAWLNFAANVMNRHADAEHAAGDTSSASTLKIIALALGGFASVASTYGNAATAHGEAFPVKAPPRDPEAVPMTDLDPANAPTA